MSLVRVLVTSDTHLTLGARLPLDLLELADRADHVVHAGDFVTMDVHDTLAALAPVTAVHGNVCDPETAARLPERAEVELGGVRIGVVHIPGASAARHERLRAWFPDCDVVVYGHTHMPEIVRSSEADMLVINPGSPVQRRRAPWHSAAWLEVAHGAVLAADLVRIDPNRAG